MTDPVKGNRGIPTASQFAEEEYLRRWQLARDKMREAGLSALLVTSQPNYRYFTGHHTQFWVSSARPLAAIIPADGAPVAVISESEMGVFRNTSWMHDVHAYPGFQESATDVLAEIFRDLGLRGEPVGVDFGLEMRFGMPVTALQQLQSGPNAPRFVDGSSVLWALRMIKSPAEVAYKRAAMRAADKAFWKTFNNTRPGTREDAVQRMMAVGMLEEGANHVGWLTVSCGRNGYLFSREPGAEQVAVGDILYIDAGCVVNGYWSDVDRIAAVEVASDAQRDDYRRIHDVTLACLDALRPGRSMAEVLEARDRAIARAGWAEAYVPTDRLGHGSGLELTEPPSVAAFDDTVLQPGMIIHLEPTMIFSHGCFMLEEAALITATGWEYVTVPAPEELPITGSR